MIKMPKKGTILAPSSLHLVLYQELLKQQDHYLSLQVPCFFFGYFLS